MYYHLSLISTDAATAGGILACKGTWSTIQKVISEKDMGRQINKM